MAKNYYLILGISPDADLENIKSAYRQKAKEFHPDRFGEETQGFLDIQEAYTILSDPLKRRLFDRQLHESRVYGMPASHPPERLGFRKASAEPLRDPDHPLDFGEASLTRSFQTFSPSFDEIFERLWRNFSGLAHPKAEDLKRLTAEIILTPDEASQGGQIRIMVPARAVCPTCGGHGGIGLYQCWRCAGEGALSGEYPVHIFFKPDIKDGTQTEVSLDRFGISNCYLRVLFRIGEPESAGTGPWEI
jgi:DnaJ-class molecular chaperone